MVLPVENFAANGEHGLNCLCQPRGQPQENLQFDWNEKNSEHLAQHEISSSEAEQVILNRPVDLDSHLRNCEERTVQIGETDAGKILIVVSTMRGKKIRVVTAWPAKERFRRYFQTQKRNGNVGRVEEQDIRE